MIVAVAVAVAVVTSGWKATPIGSASHGGGIRLMRARVHFDPFSTGGASNPTPVGTHAADAALRPLLVADAAGRG